MITQLIEYKDETTLLEAYIAYDDKTTNKRPAVLIAHDWSGKNAFALKKAEEIAQLGYVGIAIDMFGKGVLGKTKEEKSALISPFMSDREALKNRILAAYQLAAAHDQVDKHLIGAIGFCFGGLCVLDLARSGTDVKGVVSFHGLLNAPENAITHQITSKVLALHGYDDPMAKPDQVMVFADEMTEARADWQIHMFGGTMHAFMNPDANDPSFGTVYQKTAAERSWVAMKDFFVEVFGK